MIGARAADRRRALLLALPEAAVFVAGVVLLATMATHYDARNGYDFVSHWQVIAWFQAAHWTLPALGISREAYHPPLYYMLAGALLRHGMKLHGLAVVSVLFGVARLAIFAVALRIFLPAAPLARAAALAIAAILPASLHLFGMTTNEPLLNLLSAAALLAGMLALRASGAARWAAALSTGLLLGAALVTKISAFALAAALGVGVVVDLALAPSWRARARRALPFVAALAVIAAVSGWYYAHNRRLYGKAVLSSFDGRESHAAEHVDDVPLWKRRDLGYLFGWTTSIYASPGWPNGYQPRARFFPVLVASTFADYYHYGFGPSHRTERHNDPLPRTDALGGVSALGGTFVAALTVAAWLACVVIVWRRRRADFAAALALPLVAVAGQLWFAWRYPIDWEGPVKGVYLQFAALPLCALFGLGCEWLWRRGAVGRVGLAIVAVGVGCVAYYTCYCRFGS